ncbi:5983_t:CDS:2, partial [Funneliformis geosporum]
MGRRKSTITLQERNINWMLTCSDPTPLAFFQHIFPAHYGQATEKYRHILNLALHETGDPEVLNKLRRIKRTVDDARILFDWETWMQQKTAILVRRSVRRTNLHIHEEINSFAQNKSSQLSSESENSRKRKIGDQSDDEYYDEYESDALSNGEDEETSEFENDDIEDNSEGHENEIGGESDVEEYYQVKIDKNEFVQAFDKIPESSKLKLNSGRVVENVLFNYIKDNDYEHLAHSYIINCDDQEIKELFNDEEWTELTKDHFGIPQVPLDIAREIAKYGNKNLKQLREIVMKSFLPDNVSYDNDLHSDLEWIQMTIRTIVHLFENEDSPLQRNHYEYWYTIAFFGICIDILFRDSKLGTDVKRSDAPSYASSNRKNRNKKTKRKLTGRKIDGIIYLIEELHEMGAIEGARSYAGIHDKKYLSEYFKLPKTLRDMLADIIKALNYDGNRTTNIQVFGVIHLGLRVQFSRLWRVGGSITIFKKDQLYKLPHTFTIDKFKSFLKFMISIYQYKMILKNNIQVLRGEEDLEEEETLLLNELLNVGRQQTSPPNT